jgi:hypothetical protein
MNTVRTEKAAAPAGQGATTKEQQGYFEEEQRSDAGCSGLRMPLYSWP